MAGVGADELRQGRARAGHGRLARRRARAVPPRPGRRGVTTAAAERVLDLAERALRRLGGGDAQATVVRERSLFSRFARSRPTQATAVEDTTVVLRRIC